VDEVADAISYLATHPQEACGNVTNGAGQGVHEEFNIEDRMAQVREAILR